jgi:CRISPR-associated protein Csx17
MNEIPDNPSHGLENQHQAVAQPDAGGPNPAEFGAQSGSGLAEHGLRAGTSQSDLAESATRAPADATRTFDTAQGQLSYAELAEQLATPLQALDIRIRNGEFNERALDETLLLDFHAALSIHLFPEIAGRYRLTPVQVGAHEPPDAPLVPQLVHEYVLNLAARMQHLTDDADDLLLEFLAYAEGELLSIHPFPDLNGRISRLWLAEILRRLQLPPVDVVPPDQKFRSRYLAALSAADQRNWNPLMKLWKERLSQPAGINEIPLPGCTPTPLAAYLKALAVLRLIAEAAPEDGGDPEATGFWRDDVFVLRTRLTHGDLSSFFLERYRPTPLIAPWNGGSGFYPKDSPEAITEIFASASERFVEYRAAIQAGRTVVKSFGLTESPKQENKAVFLKALRNIANDSLLGWMDAALILSDDDPRYPPLLGTGGNDGRLDFTINFMQRLTELFEVAHGASKAGALDSLNSAFFGAATDSLADRAIGQFSPGAAGGPNASVGFEGNARINAWDFVLMLEGAALFAASTARRLESASAATLAAPFTVRSRAGTSGAASAGDDVDARGEIWMPLWKAPCSLDELRYLLAEGRSAVNARPSRDGLDFARAVSQLGVDRGIASFQRFGFMMRSGKAYLATPLNRIAVRRNLDADLISELERSNWLGSVQRYARDENAPNAFRSAARQLDSALFALTQQASRDAFQSVLRHVGRIDAALSISLKSHEFVRAPAPRLSSAWAIKSNDDSAEIRIAVALAGLSLRDSNGYTVLHARRHLIAVGEATNADGDRQWEPTSRVATWGKGPLVGNLSALLHRRRLEAATRGVEGELLASQTGATLGDIADFLNGQTDDRRIAELIAGLSCVDLRQFAPPRGNQDAALPPAFALLKIFFTPQSVLRALKWLPEDRSLHLPPEIPSRLGSNDVPAALRIAWQRLRAMGIKLPGRDAPKVVATDGQRWLAALCIPLTFKENARLLRDLQLQPESVANNEIPA